MTTNEMSTNELVALCLADVDPGYYQDQEEGYTVIPPGPGVARFYKTRGRIRFDGISQLSMVGHLRPWPPAEAADGRQTDQPAAADPHRRETNAR